MRGIILTIALMMFCLTIVNAQITSSPTTPTINDETTITVDINKCTNKSLLNYSGNVYVYIGVLTSTSSNSGDWKYVATDWGTSDEENKATKVSANEYSFTITPDIKTYFEIPDGIKVESIAIVLRSNDGTKKTEDLFAPVYESGLSINFTNPETDTYIEVEQPLQIQAEALNVGSGEAETMSLYVNDELIHTSNYDTIDHTLVFETTGTYWVKIVAQNQSISGEDSILVTFHKSVMREAVPEGLEDGINYIDDNTVTLVLHAPYKELIYVIGDFNNWEPTDDYLMNKNPEGQKWWITIDGLTKGEEYAYQYFVDGELRIADPYTEKVLDPWNDKYIPESTYPNLKEYPEDKTSGLVSVLQTGQEEYTWEVTGFKAPNVENMVVYEMHVQNFTEAGNIKTVTDTLNYLEKLGVNVIELMPVNEFEGNISWGYNPSFYFAFDKTYGTKNDLKEFVDACHARGIAVVVDMVFNHSFSQSPLAQMYWEGSNVTSENPWYNVSSPNTSYSWGYDFNHESSATRYFIDRANKYWLEEYNVDGFRFDFTKGFTNTSGDGWNYDLSRINILKRMADEIWAVKDDAYVILEHLTDNSEEKVLANYGMLLWGNMNCAYNQSTMGYPSGPCGSWDLSGISYKNKGWDDPHLVGYMESHDEERLMYKNLTYGNAATSGEWYDIQYCQTALHRVEMAAAFFFPVPGPKMIWEFGELGFEYSINTCSDGVTVDEDCRLALKPIRWDYYDHYDRYRLFKVFELLIKLKTEHRLTNTDDFDIDFDGAIKTLHLNGDTNVTIIGNFGMEEAAIVPGFQHTGTWYNYITGETIEVTNTGEEITLDHGEYYVYTSKPIEVGEHPSGTESISFNSSNPVVYPNPVSANGELFIKNLLVRQEITNFYLYNSLGQLVFQRNYKANQADNSQSINLNNLQLQQGVYIYRITSDTDGQWYAGKLTIK